MTKISITQTPSYDQPLVNKAVQEHMERFNLRTKLSPDTKVLIKPNLLMKRTPGEFTTTHPSIVEAVIIWLKENGITRITVADSPGGPYTVSALKGIYHASGMTDVCERHNVTLNMDTSSRNLEDRKGKSLHHRLVKQFPIITPVCDADFIIDICKLKTHAMTGLSGAVKNLFGTIPGLTKPGFHARFPEKAPFCSMLVDLCETISPDFILVDAIQAMEGNGPSGGTMRETGLILSSDNPYELDYCLCKIMGVNPGSILTVKESITRGLCCGDFNQLQLMGALPDMEPFRVPRESSLDFTTFLPPLIRRPVRAFVFHYLSAKPVILSAKCIGCGKCAESCPQKTIRIESKKAKIYYKNCIRCYCCHEMCPVKAIDIRKGLIL